MKKVGLLCLPFLMLTLTACGGAPTRAHTRSPSSPPPQPITISGSGTALPAVQQLAEAYRQKHSEARFSFDPGTNSGGAIRGVIDGTLTLAVVNRTLTPDEADKPVAYTPFARDAIVFVANNTQPVGGLTTQMIRQVYGGEVTNWLPITGQSEPMMILDRDEDESARKLGLLKLMGGQPVKARTIVLTKADSMVDSLKSTPMSLGYSSLGLIHILGPGSLQIQKLDGVAPNPESIRNGTYPWWLTFGLVYSRAADGPVADFVAFVRGPEGRAILEQYEYATLDQ